MPYRLEDIDRYADKAEKVLALSSLGALGATLVAPNPVTAGIGIGSNIAGAGIDLYQGGRALYEGDYVEALKNVGELGASLIGTKALSNAKKMKNLDNALRTLRVPRQTVTRTLKNGRKVDVPIEADRAVSETIKGIKYSSYGNISSMFNLDTYKSDNWKKEIKKYERKSNISKEKW